MNTMSVTAAMPSPPKKPGNTARRWCELQGSDSWDGLLDPLDIDLRASLIHYGELAEAAYDGYNSDTHSPDAGWCLYSEAELLAASGVSHPEHYTVTKFVYATCGFWLPPATSRTAPVPPVTDQFFAQPPPPHRPMDGYQRENVSWWRESNWIGYVAVATDDGVAALGRRDIVVAWRGTVERLEWANNANAWFTSAAPVLGSAAPNYPDAKLHRGFLSVYSSKDRRTTYNKTTSARDQVREEVGRLMEEHKDEVTSITVTGHSLGASLATLNAIDMVAHGVNVPPGCSEQQACPVTALLFASPRVGNDEFRRAFSSFPKLRALHVKNKEDEVPKIPWTFLWYADAATATLPINTDRSPFLRPGNMIRRHNLECYLHGVAGDHGEGEFWLVLERDLALVNKGTDALKDKYHIPANWWGNKEYHMIKGGDGHWRLEGSKEDKLR